MEQTFSKFLDEAKVNNSYKSEYIMNEGLGDFLSTNVGKLWADAMKSNMECYTATINMTDNAVIELIAHNLTDATPSEILSKSDEDFVNALKTQIGEFVNNLRVTAKEITKYFVGMTVDEKDIIIFFKKGGEKEPSAGVDQFKSAVRANYKLNPIFKFITVGTETVNKTAFKNANETGLSDYADNLAKPDSTFWKSPFMNSVVQKIKDKIAKTLKSEQDKAKRGNEIEVSFVPFKIDENDVNAVAKDAKDLEDFYQTMAKEIETHLTNMINSLADKDSYIGFVPVKKYGFNLYFKSEEIAQEVAEELNGEEMSAPRKRKKFEKQISKYPKKLSDKNADITAYFKGLTFTRTVINKFLENHYGDKFAGATDQVTVKEITVELDKEDIAKLIDVDIDHVDAIQIQGEASKKVKAFANNLSSAIKQSEKDNFIGISSTGTTLIFSFKGNVTAAGVAKPIMNYMKCGPEKLKLVNTTMTNEEIKNMNVLGIQSVTDAIAKLITGNVKQAEDDKAAAEKAEQEKMIPVAAISPIDFSSIQNMTIDELVENYGGFIIEESVIKNSFQKTLELSLRKSINLVTEANEVALTKSGLTAIKEKDPENATNTIDKIKIKNTTTSPTIFDVVKKTLTVKFNGIINEIKSDTGAEIEYSNAHEAYLVKCPANKKEETIEIISKYFEKLVKQYSLVEIKINH